MTLTDAVQTSNGDLKEGLFITSTFHVAELLTTGKVPVDLRFYNSEESKKSGSDCFYAIGTKTTQEATEKTEAVKVTEKVTNCTITILPTDVIKEEGVATMEDVIVFFNEKVKLKLESDYNWTIKL